MTAHIHQDDLYPQFQEQMSEATNIMPTLPSIHNRYEDDSGSDNEEDTDQ